VVSRSGRQCLYGRLDHWSIPGLFSLYNVNELEEIVSVDDIMGVEVYDAGSVPTERKLAVISVENVHSRLNRYPMNPARVGHTGMPRLPAPLERMKDPNPPICGFVQIWTRISW
jgi:hypothetical protein